MYTKTTLPAPATMLSSTVPPIDVMQPQPVGFDSPIRRNSLRHPREYSQSDWQSKKPLIKRFYIDLGKPLNQVAAIMSQEHNFHAT